MLNALKFALYCAIGLMFINIISGDALQMKDNIDQENFIKTDNTNELQKSSFLEKLVKTNWINGTLDARSSSVEAINRAITNQAYFDARLDSLPPNCAIQRTPTNCAEATACTKLSGYYFIQPSQLKNQIFLAECDADTDGGVWTVIQKRLDGSVDFNRSWVEYKAGFGDIEGEYFIGLDKLHALTNYDGRQELSIEMEMDSVTKYAKYDSFVIGDESVKYILKSIGSYSGNAGDSLTYHINEPFSTKDQDNAKNSQGNCAIIRHGGWWFERSGYCLHCNLNGDYGNTEREKGVNWYSFSGDYTSLTYDKMMIRRRRY